MNRKLKLLCAAGLAASAMTQIALAANVTRNTNAVALNDPSAWNTGSLPTASDIAVWNSASVGGSQSLGASASWGGILVTGAVPTSGPTITDPGGTTLTLGADGINLGTGAATNRGVTINPAISLAADQTWWLGSGGSASIVTTGAISGSGKLTVLASNEPSPLGVLNLQNSGSTYSGGTVIQPGAIVTISTPATLYTATGGVLSSSVFGTGALTINGGRINNTSKAIYTPAVNIGGDFTYATTARADVSGNFNMGGATRTMNLTRGTTAANIIIGGGNNAVRFQTVTGGAATSNFTNGLLRFVADNAVVTAGNYSGVNFGTVNGNTFSADSGFVIGNRVVVSFATSFSWSGLTAPNVTVESGGYMALSDGGANRNINVRSLSGSGIVTNLSSAANDSLLTINGQAATSSADFSGVIKDSDTAAFPTASAAHVVSVVKAGETTQILSGLNTYTGSTYVVGGTLAVNTIANGGSPSSLGASSASATSVLISGGTLKYAGAATTSDRLFVVRTTGGSIDASGTGALSLSNIGAIVSDDPAARATSGTTGSTTITGTTQDLVVGLTVSGTHIAPGTTIVAVDRYNGTATLSQPLISDATNLNTTFTTAARTLTLTGSNTDSNLIAGSFADSAGGAALSIRKSGAGTWRLTGANTYTGATIVDTGTLQLGEQAQTPVLISAGGAEITGGRLELEYSSSNPSAVVQAALAASAASGFTSGQFRSPGLTAGHALGWKDNGAGVITVLRTRVGDANLDLLVNFDDLLLLAQNYSTSATGKIWGEGDFSYDGRVDFDDLLGLAQNYGGSAIASTEWASTFSAEFGSDWALALSMVPEPSLLSAIAIPAMLIARKRR